MAFRDRVVGGNSVPSLESLQAGGEPIPREYHRKVLKKIAQLTKVGLVVCVANRILHPPTGNIYFEH